MMEKDFLVSVIIPNYNHSSFLKERIESVIAQTYNNYEVILMDDCSKDNSRDIIEEYRLHPKVSQVIFNEVNSGSTFKQWNKGISAAKGHYIWIAESDDVASPLFLEKIMAPIMSDEKIVLSFSQSYRMDHKGSVTGSWLDFMKSTDKDLFLTDFVLEGSEFIKRSLLFKNTIPNASSLVFKKLAYLEIGGADTTLKYCSDWLTWLKIATVGKVSFNTSPLNYFRYHQNSVIAKSKVSKEIFKKKYDIILRELFAKFLKSSSPDTSILGANEKQKQAEIEIEKFVILKAEKKYLSAVGVIFPNIFDNRFFKMFIDVMKESISEKVNKTMLKKLRKQV
ncbi:glycosyltransferase family 2 protein [Chryseobacterium sp. KACC 21268]|nr:glycosyltransferase family 2 protein [Chryseobacterium sp. KACC 21268]